MSDEHEPPRNPDGSIHTDDMPVVAIAPQGAVVFLNERWVHLVPREIVVVVDQDHGFTLERSQVVTSADGSMDIAIPATEVVHYAWTLWHMSQCHGVFATLRDAQNGVHDSPHPPRPPLLWGPLGGEIAARAIVYVLAGTDWRVVRYTLGEFV